jgi:CheY-like chemotaxis protein
VNIATHLRPDIIVMDLSMPKLDGIAATRRLKEQPRTRALQAGVDVFLTKPCFPEELEAHVRPLNAPGTP